MEIRELPLDQLKPAPYHPRVALTPGDPAYLRLKHSLDSFDFVQPLVWNERTGHIVAGWQRWAIARADHRRTIPCVVVNLSLNREKALNVALNNSAIGSDWDDDRLRALLLELNEQTEVDATLTGFDAEELRELLLQPVPLPECDTVPRETEAISDTDDDLTRVRVTLWMAHEVWELLRSRFDEMARDHPLEWEVHVPQTADC